jgi:hypothetical protein
MDVEGQPVHGEAVAVTFCQTANFDHGWRVNGVPESVITLAAEIRAVMGHPYGVGSELRHTVSCPR